MPFVSLHIPDALSLCIGIRIGLSSWDTVTAYEHTEMELVLLNCTVWCNHATIAVKCTWQSYSTKVCTKKKKSSQRTFMKAGNLLHWCRRNKHPGRVVISLPPSFSPVFLQKYGLFQASYLFLVSFQLPPSPSGLQCLSTLINMADREPDRGWLSLLVGQKFFEMSGVNVLYLHFFGTGALNRFSSLGKKTHTH